MFRLNRAISNDSQKPQIHSKKNLPLARKYQWPPKLFLRAVYLCEWVSSNSRCQKISRTRKRGAGARREWETERETRERETDRIGWTFKTELDTIRKSILRQWYAVKIILVSAVTRRVQGAGGDQKGEARGRRGMREGDGTGFPDTKTVRFGISQNLWYACIWREQTRTVLSACSITLSLFFPLPPSRSYRVVSLERVTRQPVRGTDCMVYFRVN